MLLASAEHPDAMATAERLLAVSDLHVEFRTGSGVVHAVNGVDLTLDAREVLALVGESGSGKSITGEAIMGIVDMPPGVIPRGSIALRGTDLLALDEAERNRARGSKIAMIFQDALATLNPVLTVGDQIAEMFRAHRKVSAAEARELAIAVMERVQIPAARARFDNYPHQFSGGMRQRIMIAMAVALDPDVLIADEPTTALDVTVQAGIIELLGDLCMNKSMGLILITHDLSVVANIADRVAVMYAGRIVENAPVEAIFERALHPYTIGLIQSVPRVDSRTEGLTAIPGKPPDPRDIPKGCPFHPRCRWMRDRCTTEMPALRSVGHRRSVACHFAEEIADVS